MAPVNLQAGQGAARGWAIPTATDIAFALAVLAVIGRHLPSALRTFLLTLAVVDDLLAITIIAVFYTHHLDLLPLMLATVPLALFTALVQRRIRSWWLLLPLAGATWALVHASGVHATVAGVLLGFTVPVRGRNSEPGLAGQFEHRWRPLSAGVTVPVFAFLAAGVPLGGGSGLAQTLTGTVAVGIILALVIGKPVGIFAAAYTVARFTRADLDRTCPGSTSSGSPCSAGSVSPCPCSSASSPTAKAASATTRRRSPSSPALCSPPASPRSCCAPEPAPTGGSAKPKPPTSTVTAHPTSTRPPRREPTQETSPAA